MTILEWEKILLIFSAPINVTTTAKNVLVAAIAEKIRLGQFRQIDMQEENAKESQGI